MVARRSYENPIRDFLLLLPYDTLALQHRPPVTITYRAREKRNSPLVGTSRAEPHLTYPEHQPRSISGQNLPRQSKNP